MSTVKPLNKKLKFLFLASLIGLPAGFASAFGIIPVFDGKNFIENMGKQIGDLQHRISEEIEAAAKRELKKELKSVAEGIKGQKEAVAQRGKAELEKNVRNHKVALDNLPSSGFCDNHIQVGDNGQMIKTGRQKHSILAFSMRFDYCDPIHDVKKDLSDDVKKDMIPTKISLEDKERQTQSEIDTLTSLHNEIEGRGAVYIDDIMTDRELGLMPSEYNEAHKKLKVMLPVVKSDSLDEMTSQKIYLNKISKSMRSKIPYDMQLDNLTDKLKTEEGVLSEREAQELFAKDFFNAENIESYSFKDMVSPSQTKRDVAIMKAFHVHMAVQSFKASLDKEMLIAIRLLEAIPD